MRSSDLVWGVPFDVMQFSMVAMAVARVVQAIPYTVSLVAGSAHIYESTMMSGPEGDPRFFALADDLPIDLNGLTSWARGEVITAGTWLGGVPQGIVMCDSPVAWHAPSRPTVEDLNEV